MIMLRTASVATLLDRVIAAFIVLLAGVPREMVNFR
jgi:hypothetical protein